MLYRGTDEASATSDEDDRLGVLGRHDGKKRQEVGSGKRFFGKFITMSCPLNAEDFYRLVHLSLGKRSHIRPLLPYI